MEEWERRGRVVRIAVRLMWNSEGVSREKLVLNVWNTKDWGWERVRQVQCIQGNCCRPSAHCFRHSQFPPLPHLYVDRSLARTTKSLLNECDPLLLYVHVDEDVPLSLAHPAPVGLGPRDVGGDKAGEKIVHLTG